jgi:hypothetical protein
VLIIFACCACGPKVSFDTRQMQRRTLLGGLAAAVALGGQQRPALAQSQTEILAAATLRSVLLVGRDWRAEREATERLLREQREREEEFIIPVGNSCGGSESTFRIVRATTDTPAEIVERRSIDEWCRAPIPFEQQHWLLVLHPETRSIVANFAAMLTPDGELIALRSSYPSRTLSSATEAQLTLTPLQRPVPVSMPGRPNADDLNMFASQRPGHEVQDSRVVITHAIILSRIFPGLRFDDFL